MKQLLTSVFLLLSLLSFSQNATITGVILNEKNLPVGDINVSITGTSIGNATDNSGFYKIIVPANELLELKFSAIGYETIIIKNLKLANNQIFELNPVIKSTIEEFKPIEIDAIRDNELRGITKIKPAIIRNMIGAQPGVENLLKSLPSISSNNELSTQYNVRGGNFDENLVYINEIEVYRPFLIRSGQQEGLSIVNSDLVRDVKFSAGGFQARYGDKLSSVLDIEYRRPTQFAAGIDASLLGVSSYVEGTAFAKALTATLGVRYRDNSLFVNSRETEAITIPRFFDAQTHLTYQLSPKFELSFLGNIAINDYEFEPLTSQTNFGTVNDAQALIIDYDGQENDRYETYFGAIKASYDVNNNLNVRLISSVYHTQEQEYYDILARYSIGRPNTDIGGSDLGEVDFTTSIGSELDHGRNNLDALITTAQLKSTYTIPSSKKNKDVIDASIKFNKEDIRDRLREYTVIDSAGFSVRPPLPEFRNQQPYFSYTAPLVPFESARADNDITIDRVQAFIQYSSRGYLGDHETFWNAGIRSHTWTVAGDGVDSNTQTVFSPRAQFAIKPYWKKTDMLFRLSGGLYHQPPFYRELRDQQGTVQPQVEAQKSVHIVLGNDWSFNWSSKKDEIRPFKLTTEVYYKDLWDVNTYTLENVRLRYRANNNATAYAYGIETRMNGEFIKGTESWISLAYMRTQENLDNRGFIDRPTDQRLKAAFLFQDYVPTIPNLRAYLNMVYSTGLPGGSPSYADPYDFQFRLKDYFRADLGVQLELVGPNKVARDESWLANFTELSIGAQIYNIFNYENQISNLWVRDVASQAQYAVPVRLTPRVFNIRLLARL
ncbi:putative ferric aerobactin receptor [Nonlabens tegetincola]|uniref:Putative ferric aerobactin receptor n=1 Tax=Nonlabens tegetincola TaxID=323273 RepID=A0A090PZV5_9FLAO|nr:carboxypeptidase-like regulatory domain-containing protein [Nonlabens tegetincola]GAK96320.1 putative ferric aerobactin receptor [Nonlabens tegetincola]